MQVIATITHCDKFGQPKIRRECSLPLTGRGVIRRIITELAVFDVDLGGAGGLTLMEIAEGVSVQEIRDKTDAPFRIAQNLILMRQ